MADTDFHGADYGAETPSRVLDAARNFGTTNWLGAAASMALTAGVAVWAVNLTFGDVSSVPVIRALEGPMRMAPEDPGGTHMPYQGLALSDITSGGAAAPAPEQIVLAPAPVTLEAPSLGERTAALDTPTPEELAEASATDEAPFDGEAEALLAELTAGSVDPGDSPLTELEGLEIVSADADADLTAETAEDTGAKTIQVLNPLEPGLSTSNRPRVRPAALRAVAASQPATSPLAAPAANGQQVASLQTTSDISTAPIPLGTRVVQLGAFDSEAIARSEWARLSGKFGDYFAGHAPVVQEAQSGGRTFWRLRVTGFADAAEARRLCTALLAQQQACISVVVR